MYIYIFYFSFYYSWCDVLQDFINLINVDVDVSLYWYAFSETTTLYRNQFECDVFKEKTP